MAGHVSTEVALREEGPALVRLSTEQLQYIAHTEFVPKSMRGKLPAILACVATGRSLGLSDMSALRSINIIDGKASFSAELMVSLVRERGHSITGNFAGDSCTVVGKRADNGDEMSVTWTIEMAKDAGLAGKDNWKKYTPSMLWARAVSQLCRMLFADCFAGATYTPEELAAGTVAEWEDESSGPEHPSGGVESPSSPVASGPDPDSAGDPSGDQTAAPLDAATPAADEVAASQSSPADAPLASVAKRKKLDVLIGQLRDQAGRITTEQIYAAVGRDQSEARFHDEDGILRWRLLRDTLTSQEASDLIERLERFAGNRGAAA